MGIQRPWGWGSELIHADHHCWICCWFPTQPGLVIRPWLASTFRSIKSSLADAWAASPERSGLRRGSIVSQYVTMIYKQSKCMNIYRFFNSSIIHLYHLYHLYVIVYSILIYSIVFYSVTCVTLWADPIWLEVHLWPSFGDQMGSASEAMRHTPSF